MSFFAALVLKSTSEVGGPTVKVEVNKESVVPLRTYLGVQEIQELISIVGDKVFSP